MSRAELKQCARYSLINNFGETLKIILIYYAITVGLSFGIGFLGLNEGVTSLLSSVIGVIVGGLIYFGYNSYFLKVARVEEVTYEELFSKTKMFWRCVGLSFLIGFFTALWSFLMVIPGIIASINYSIAYFVALDNPELGVMAVLRKSKEIMDGHKLDFFILILSFLAWIIIGLFTFGVLYLWLIPYMQITIANFYDEIKD